MAVADGAEVAVRFGRKLQRECARRGFLLPVQICKEWFAITEEICGRRCKGRRRSAASEEMASEAYEAKHKNNGARKDENTALIETSAKPISV